jgi:hypothetical protein
MREHEDLGGAELQVQLGPVVRALVSLWMNDMVSGISCGKHPKRRWHHASVHHG